eukprot:Nitzschia sp. Nitz4//NODE_464_length_17123_cov_69.824057//7738//8457//NITZ4_additional_000064-RA//1//CDS//3329531918//5250//frame0
MSSSRFFLPFVFIFLLEASGIVAISSDEDTTVQVRFYGESMCPGCRMFVTQGWPSVWEDDDLMQFVEYDFVAWGNSYFTTSKCGGAPYDPQVRSCWYQECTVTSSDDEDGCFGGEPVYQHGQMEGEVDIYENCVKLHFGIKVAVDFTACCEGDNMEDTDSATELAKYCFPTQLDFSVVEKCFQEGGHKMEVMAAKQTPDHPGVPYVLVDGEIQYNPLGVKDAVCQRLNALNVVLPASCT